MRHLPVENPVTYVYIKILISHFQIMGILATIDVGWDQTSFWIIKIFYYISDTSFFYFPECLLHFILKSNDSVDSSFRIFNYSIIAAGLFPFVMLLIAALFWALVNYNNKVRGKKPILLKQNIQASMITLMFIFYPRIMFKMFQYVSCTGVL